MTRGLLCLAAKCFTDCQSFFYRFLMITAFAVRFVLLSYSCAFTDEIYVGLQCFSLRMSFKSRQKTRKTKRIIYLKCITSMRWYVGQRLLLFMHKNSAELVVMVRHHTIAVTKVFRKYISRCLITIVVLMPTYRASLVRVFMIGVKDAGTACHSFCLNENSVGYHEWHHRCGQTLYYDGDYPLCRRSRGKTSDLLYCRTLTKAAVANCGNATDL